MMSRRVVICSRVVKKYYLVVTASSNIPTQHILLEIAAIITGLCFVRPCPFEGFVLYGLLFTEQQYLPRDIV